jgi:hypothetical protein
VTAEIRATSKRGSNSDSTDSPDEFDEDNDYRPSMVAMRRGNVIYLGEPGETFDYLGPDEEPDDVKDDEKDDEALPKTPKEGSKSEDVEMRDAGASKVASESTTATDTTSDKKEGTAP